MFLFKEPSKYYRIKHIFEQKLFWSEKNLSRSKEWNGRCQSYREASVKNCCETKSQWNWRFSSKFLFSVKQSSLVENTLLKPNNSPIIFFWGDTTKIKCHHPECFLFTRSYHLPSNEDLAGDPGGSLTFAAQTKRTQSFPTKTFVRHCLSEGRALLKLGASKGEEISSRNPKAMWCGNQVPSHWKSGIPVQSRYNFGSWFSKMTGVIKWPSGVLIFEKRGAEKQTTFRGCYCGYERLQATLTG